MVNLKEICFVNLNLHIKPAGQCPRQEIYYCIRSSHDWLGFMRRFRTFWKVRVLKGVCHEIFDLHFFHDSIPSRPLINRLKYFKIRFRFRQDIRILKKLSGVHPTAESDSAVCIIPRSQTPQCASYRGVRLCSVHHTAESDPAQHCENLR